MSVRRGLVALTALLALTVASSNRASAEERPDRSRKPNIVLLVADDLGYADVGFQGCRDIPTPSIDRIAAEGVRFTQGYVSCPVCSPTRAGLVTGRYQQRFGHEFNTGGNRDDFSEVGLPTTEVTLADVLGKAGYATGAIGKWHLGREAKFHPLKRGFDDFFGFLHGGRSYWNDPRGKASPLLRGSKPIPEHGYLTDEFGREAAAFIEGHKDGPFLLYVAFNAVHTPMHAKPDDERRFRSIPEGKRRTYAGMVHAMDRAVGRVLDTLRRHDLEKNTLVVFLSDNGGPTRANGSRNDPLRGDKGTVYEGGIRVPFAMRWPAALPARTVYAWPVMSLDLAATAAAAAGTSFPRGRRLDGVDLLPHLLGRTEGGPHETLHWRSGESFAVRHGDLKLLRSRGGKPELYDLAADPSEENSLAATRREEVAKLLRIHAAWEAGTVEPRWPRPVRNRRGGGGARQLTERFDQLDKDGDGRLTRQEGRGLRRFDDIDRNGDGAITRAEAEAWARRRR